MSNEHPESVSGHFARLEDLINERFQQIMSALSDFTDKLTTFFDRQDVAITDLQGDIKNLQDQITALNNSPGTFTPEDQKLVDAMLVRVSAMSDKLDALDALVPPVVPPPTP